MTPLSLPSGVQLALERSAALLRDVSRLGLRLADGLAGVAREAPAPPLDQVGGPPADWLAKVRSGAPHLLEAPSAVEMAPPAIWTAAPRDPAIRAGRVSSAVAGSVRPPTEATTADQPVGTDSREVPRPTRTSPPGLGEPGDPARQQGAVPQSPMPGLGVSGPPAARPGEARAAVTAPVGPRLMPVDRPRPATAPGFATSPLPDPAAVRPVSSPLPDPAAVRAPAASPPHRREKHPEAAVLHPLPPRDGRAEVAARGLDTAAPSPHRAPTSDQVPETTRRPIAQPSSSNRPTAEPTIGATPPAARARTGVIDAQPGRRPPARPAVGAGSPAIPASRAALSRVTADGSPARQRAPAWTSTLDPDPASWPDLGPNAPDSALDPFEERTSYQRGLQRAQFLHSEQERWS